MTMLLAAQVAGPANASWGEVGKMVGDKKCWQKFHKRNDAHFDRMKKTVIAMIAI